MEDRPSDRIDVIVGGWLMVAAGMFIGFVSMAEIHWYTARFWSFTAGICLVVGGVAETLYRDPVRRYLVRLGWYFGGVVIIAVGAGVIYYVATQNPVNKNLPLVSGAALVIVGIFISMHSESSSQWRRRMWLTVLGMLVLAVGAFVVGIVGYATVLGHRTDSGTAVVMLSAVVLSLAGAAIAFVAAWRTPTQPSSRSRTPDR